MTAGVATFGLSAAQERLWRLADGPALAVCTLVRLAAPAAPEAVAAAAAALVGRHEALRTTFPFVAGIDLPVQAVGEETRWEAVEVELSPGAAAPSPTPPSPTPPSSTPPDDPSAEEAVLAAAWERLAAAATPFDLAAGPLLRVVRFHGGAGADRLVGLVTPALTADPASHRLLAGELARLVAGGGAGPGEEDEAVQYVDASEWQRELLASDDGREGREHWHRRLAPAALAAGWPGERQPAAGDAAAATAATSAARVERELPPGLAARLAARAGELGAAPETVVAAAWLAVLTRHLGREEVVLGWHHRGRKYEALEGTVGLFARHLPLPFRLAADRPFAGLVAEVAVAAAAADEWEEYFSWRDLARALELPSPPPVPFAFASAEAGDDGGPVARQEGSVEPTLLALGVALRGESPRLALTCDPARLDAAEAGRVVDRLLTLLAAALDAPRRALGDLDLLPPAERRALLETWSGADGRLPEGSVHAAFAAQAAARPDAVAVVDGAAHLSFGELERRAAALAGRIAARGIGRGGRVALALPRGAEQVVAAIAVLETGAAFVPLDPEQPPRRSAALLDEVAAGAAWAVVTRRRLLAALPPLGPRAVLLDEPADGAPPLATPVAVDGDDLAYVLFTSGSTGRPKGAMVTHRSVLNLVAALEEAVYAGEPASRVGVNAPLVFDASIKQVAQLLRGRTLHLVPEEVRRDGEAFVAFLAERRLDSLDATPSQLGLLLDAGLTARRGGPRRVLLGGEPIPPALWRRLAREGEAAGIRFHNLYGPTECTVDTTAAPVAGDGPPTLGRPLANVRAYVVDERLQPVAPGVAGELLIGGAGLARGYAGRPGRTAASFLPDPFGGRGGRLYASGDLVRHLPDGRLVFVGRRDHQVKLRGHRLELGEVEAAVGEHPAVGEAVALLAAGEGGDGRLVAYVTFSGEPASIAELAAFAGERLPAWAVPAAWVALDRLPLTRNGKVDRAALPAPDAAGALALGDQTSPRTPFEEMLAAVWREVLGVERVGMESSFFDLGGHSLLGTQLVARIRQVFQVELPLRHLFEEPTVRQLAARLAAALDAGGGEAAPPLVAVARDRPLPLSFGQQRLWFLDRLEPGNPMYNLAASVEIAGEVDVAALRRALAGLVARHEVLRTRFGEGDDGPVQVVAERGTLALPEVDVSALPAAAREAEVARRAGAEALAGFDLARGPLARAVLLTLEPGRWRLLLVMHHAVSDAWSTGVLLRDLTALYRAAAVEIPAGAAALSARAGLPELALQYADYAVWQRRWMQGEALARHLAWWRARLGGELPVLSLPTDRPRPAAPSFRGGFREAVLPAPLAAAVGGLARRHGVTLFMVVLAAFAALLRRWAGQEELVVGVPVAGRGHLELEGLIGFFVNTLALRLEVSGAATVGDLLAATRTAALGAYAHQDLPFEKLVEELAPARDLGGSPLFRVMCMHQNTPRQPLELPGVRFSRPRNEGRTAILDLALTTAEEGGALACQLEYAGDLYEPATADRLLRGFLTLLAGFADSPAAPLAHLPLLDEAERRQALLAARGPEVEIPALPLHALFEAAAAVRPDAVAVAAGAAALSFGELERRSAALAWRLRALGVAPEVPVAILLDRSPELAVAVLAALRAGGACLPLDPDQPSDRIASLLGDAAAPVVLTARRLADRLPAAAGRVTVMLDEPGLDLGARRHDDEPIPLPSVDPDAAAYVIYTSGSTGRPKAVVLPHRGLVGYTLDMVRRFGLVASDRVLQFAALSFDVVIEELFPAWAAGAAAVVAPRERLAEPAAFSALVRGEQVTLCELPAAYWHNWMAEMAAAGEAPPACLARLIVGSEKPAAETVAAWERLGVPLIYIFGLTETSVTSSLFTLPSPLAAARGHDLPIGRPVDNTVLRVVDLDGDPAPPGLVGELLVGGAGVARGYLGRPRLTAERFVPDPFAAEPGARLYRTGDRARRLDGGELDFLGRADRQINLRGLRIEPGEVEAVLERHPAVRQAVVEVRVAPSGERVLAAWVAAPGSDAGLVEELRAAARRALPEPMVPARVAVLDALPTTPHGKVDRRALPEPAWREAGGSSRPLGAVEELLAGLWCELLGVEAVAPESDFFALGGHSLLATQLLARVRRALGVEPPLRSLFEAPRLADFAAAVEAARAGRRGFAPPPLRPAPAGEPPVASFAQRRLWLQQRLDPASVAYNLPGALRLRGELDLAALGHTFTEVVRRHRVLRTVFAADGAEPVPRVLPPRPLAVPVVDLSSLPAAAATRRADALLRREARTPFDLERGPLLRLHMLRMAPPTPGGGEHLLLLSMHHVVFDAWSSGVLLGEVAALYPAFAAGRPPALPEPAVQYSDFARWQRDWLAGEVRQRYLDWWRARLEGAPPSPLPAAGTGRGGEAGASFQVEVAGDLAAELRRLARREGVTLFMTLLAVFDVTLWHGSGQEDVVVGTDVANRTAVEAEGLIGFFVNQLVLRSDLGGDPTFRELLARVREVTLGAYEHQELPFDELVRALRPERDDRHPLFQAKLVLQNAAVPELEGLGVALEPVRFDRGVAKFDLLLDLEDRGEGPLAGRVEHRTDRLGAAAARGLAERFAALLRAVVERPEARLSELAAGLAAAERSASRDSEERLAAAGLDRLRRRRRAADDAPVGGAR